MAKISARGATELARVTRRAQEGTMIVKSVAKVQAGDRIYISRAGGTADSTEGSWVGPSSQQQVDDGYFELAKVRKVERKLPTTAHGVVRYIVKTTRGTFTSRPNVRVYAVAEGDR